MNYFLPLVLFAGFSATFVELVTHIFRAPWAGYVVIFPWLLWRAIRAGPNVQPSPWIGWSLIVSGLLVQLVFLAGGFDRIARLALPLVLIGFIRLRGLGTWRIWILAVWLVPIPTTTSALFSPQLETFWLRMATLIVSRVVDIGTEGATAFSAAGRMELLHWDGGLWLVALLSGLGWYAAVRKDRSLRSTIQHSALWVLPAPLILIAGISSSLLVFGLGSPGLARLVLVPGLWLAVAAVGLSVVQTNYPAEGGRVREL